MKITKMMVAIMALSAFSTASGYKYNIDNDMGYGGRKLNNFTIYTSKQKFNIGSIDVLGSGGVDTGLFRMTALSYEYDYTDENKKTISGTKKFTFNEPQGGASSYKPGLGMPRVDRYAWSIKGRPEKPDLFLKDYKKNTETPYNNKGSWK